MIQPKGWAYYGGKKCFSGGQGMSILTSDFEAAIKDYRYDSFEVIISCYFSIILHFLFSFYFHFLQVRYRAYNMKTPVHLILQMIDDFYDADNEDNTFDLGVQYLDDKVFTFPRVEKRPGCGEDLRGFKSYPLFKGLVPSEFDGGSFTWKTTHQVDETDLYTQTK